MLRCTKFKRKSKGREKTYSRKARKYKGTNYLGRRRIYMLILTHKRGEKEGRNTPREIEENKGEEELGKKRDSTED